MANWVGAQCQVKLAQKLRKHALIVTSSPENPKRKVLCSISSRRLGESVDALKELSSSIGWRVMELQKFAKFGKKSGPCRT